MRRRFVVDMNLQKQAPMLRFKWTMEGARRPACVGVWRKADATITIRVVADDQVTRDKVNLFPIVVDEGRGGVDTGSKAEMPGAKATLVFFIQRTCQDLLLDPLRISRWCLPARAQVDGIELFVFLLNHYLPPLLTQSL